MNILSMCSLLRSNEETTCLLSPFRVLSREGFLFVCLFFSLFAIVNFPSGFTFVLISYCLKCLASEVWCSIPKSKKAGADFMGKTICSMVLCVCNVLYVDA